MGLMSRLVFGGAVLGVAVTAGILLYAIYRLATEEEMWNLPRPT